MAKIDITKTELAWTYNEDGSHREVACINLPKCVTGWKSQKAT